MASDRPGAGAPPPPPGYPTAGPSTAAPPPSSFPPPPPGYPGAAAPQAAPYYGNYPAAAPPGAAPCGYNGYNGYNAPPAYAYPPAAMAAGSSSFMTRPYQMPAKQNTGPWGGGGPVGSGVVPHDVEAQVMAAFADAEVRRGFQRKVLSIVTIQLMVTVGFACVCMFVHPIKNYVQSQPWPFYLAWALSFGLLLVISCNERLRRSHPINIILLGLFTLCEAFLVGMITCFFDIEIVLLAFICTLGAVMVLFAIASSKCVDLTGKASVLLVASTLLLILVLVGIFWVNTIWWLVISGIGALLASMYIVYDLQLIMGGKQYAISPDEYIFASLSLYLDIVQLFIWILYIIGIGKSM